MKLGNLLGSILKGISFLSAIWIVLLGFGVFIYSVYKIYLVLDMIINDDAAKDTIVIVKALKAIDLVLLSVIFLIMGASLYELFFQPIENLPKWLAIKNIDELKSMLLKVIIVIMGVSFAGRVITWDSQTNLLGYGVGLGAVILALSYFLKVKGKGEKDPLP